MGSDAQPRCPKDFRVAPGWALSPELEAPANTIRLYRKGAGSAMPMTLKQLEEKWRNRRAHTYTSENADHYRGYDVGLRAAADELAAFRKEWLARARKHNPLVELALNELLGEDDDAAD